jgi:hypothetical protein
MFISFFEVAMRQPWGGVAPVPADGSGLDPLSDSRRTTGPMQRCAGFILAEQKTGPHVCAGRS